MRIAFATTLEEGEASQLAADLRAARRRQASRQRRRQLRSLPGRGCLIGNTMSPGTDVEAFKAQLFRI